MKRFAATLFIVVSVVIFAATGSIRLQPEHQAYVLFLGMELTEDGEIALSALCPKIAGKEQSEYQLFESRGSTVSQAFQALERNIPRHVVYVQLKALLMTPEFAGSPRMNELIYYLLLGAEYYSDAWLMIGETPPSSFLADYRPAIGTRLSASIQATMATAADLNMIPSVHLADLLDGWSSLYGDVPAIAYSVETFGDTPSIKPEGAYLFAGETPVLQLDAEETALMNWLRGDSETFHLSDGGNVISLTPELPPRVLFDRENGRIRISGHFVQHEQADSIVSSQAQYLLEARIQALVEKCQAVGSEPFRFGEYAAARCIDLNAFLAQDFVLFYRNADITMHAVVRDELT